MNIYLVCNAGMSTSILVKKMQEAAAKQGLSDVHIEAFSVEVLDERVDTADCVLLGPQIRHMLGDVKKIAHGKRAGARSASSAFRRCSSTSRSRWPSVCRSC